MLRTRGDFKCAPQTFLVFQAKKLLIFLAYTIQIFRLIHFGVCSIVELVFIDMSKAFKGFKLKKVSTYLKAGSKICCDRMYLN